MKMAVKTVIVGVLMVWCVLWGRTDFAIAQEQIDVLQIGRYQFIHEPSWWWGYRVDTATGEVWRITAAGVEQYWPPASPVPLGVGRFYVTFGAGHPRFRVDTVTGEIWMVNYSDGGLYLAPFAPQVGLTTAEEYLRRTYEQQVSQLKAKYKDFEDYREEMIKVFEAIPELTIAPNCIEIAYKVAKLVKNASQ